MGLVGVEARLPQLGELEAKDLSCQQLGMKSRSVAVFVVTYQFP